MTVRALAGLAALNVAYAVVGLSLLWGRSRFARGAACSGSPGSGTCSASRRSASSGRRSSSRVSRSGPWWSCSPSSSSQRPASWPAGSEAPGSTEAGPDLGAGPILLVSAASVALAGLFLEALFRTARLSSLQEYDAWAFWVPKGLAIFFFDGLDAHVFTTAPNATYPPLQPVLDAAAFHAMGGPDVVTLHVQFWFLVVGAVAAVAGLLHRHAPAWLLWPPLLLVLVVPRFGERLLAPQADVLLQVLVVVAALLVALWLRDRGDWRLGAAAVLLAAGANTKREGILLAASVLAAGFVFSRPRWWPRLAAASAFVAVTVLPWRTWAGRHDIGAGAPSSPFGNGRFRGALDLSFEVLYSNARWSVLPVVATIALAAALVWGDRRLAGYLALLGVLFFAGGVWSTAGFPELAISANEGGNPIVRYTGSMIFLAAVALPLLLTSVWRAGEDP